ncbi:hypothetical protein HDU67_001171 [Dinochytrium kinnereticum]|nr:hypothetical protein HDU67_001171 [Dinochytrium kinnereticum]
MKPSAADCDRPPAANYSLDSDPLPKAFLRAMRRMDAITAKPDPRRTTLNHRNNNTTTTAAAAAGAPAGGKVSKKTLPTSADALTKRPGETYKEFSRRINDNVRKSINAATQSQTKTAIKRKAKLNERKQKLKEKRRKGKTQEDMEDRMDGHTVLFGTQASAPPTFTVKPKKIGGASKLRNIAASAAASAELEDAATRGDSQESKPKQAGQDEGGDKVGRRTKLRELPLSQQKILGEERAKVIELYRMAKQRKASNATASGLDEEGWGEWGRFPKE